MRWELTLIWRPSLGVAVDPEIVGDPSTVALPHGDEEDEEEPESHVL